MNKKKNILMMCLVIAIIGFVKVDFAFAGNNWNEYFAVDEAKEIKKMVKKSVIHEFENPEGDWKNLIRGKSIKDGAISARHLKDGALLKKTIYTLHIECDKDFADRVEREWGDEEEVNYYKKIDVKELNISNLPSITIYAKKSRLDEGNDSWADNGWDLGGVNHFKIEDDKMWVRYATIEDGEENFRCWPSDYKIIVVN